jgi:serine phosphatase RsbU (regulator of sigma subunit)
MFRNFIISILCIGHLLLSAQTSSKFNSLVDSANKYENTDWSLSYSFAKMALQNKGNDFSYKDIISLNVIFDTYYQKLNMLDSAFSINKQSLKLATDNKDTTLIAYSLINIANVYSGAGNFESSIKMYHKALSILEKLKDIKQIAAINYNLSTPYGELGMHDSARIYTDIAFANYNKIKDYSGLAMCYDYYGSESDRLGNYKDAIRFYKLEIQNFELVNETANLIIPYQNMAGTYLKLKDYDDCKKYLELAMNLAISLGSKSDMYEVSLIYSDYYNAIGDYKNAYSFIKRYYEGKDTVINDQLKTELSDQKSEFDRENASALLKIQKLEAEKNLKSKEFITWGLILSSLFFGVILFLSINRYRMKQKSFLKLNEYKNQLVFQKEKIEETQKEIIDSITYAKRLQEAILPPFNLIQTYLPNSFVFYQPKHIIAGDFYFFEVVDSKIIIASADSTGHGVPGALVSVVCSNALNRSIKEFKLTEPGLILDKTRELVLETFSKSDSTVKDGMDISLVCIHPSDASSHEINISWAGANNPFWYIRQNQLLEIKGNKQSIGLTENPQSFVTHHVILHKGDTMYLITDGFADQFGGNKEKKFKYKSLQDLLLMNSSKPMKDQIIILSESFNTWKGNLDQVDDVCIIGIRV